MPQPSKLYQVLQWVKQEGEAKAIDRIRAKVLPVTIKESIYLNQVTPETECSPACLQAIIQAANQVVGKPCPITA